MGTVLSLVLACSYPERLVFVTSPVTPTGVPLNAVVQLNVLGAAFDGGVTLTAGGVTVPASVHEIATQTAGKQTFELMPVAPLSPQTLYEVDGLDGVAPATFTTGSATDTTMPSLTGFGREAGPNVQLRCENDPDAGLVPTLRLAPQGLNEPVTFNVEEGSALLAADTGSLFFYAPCGITPEGPFGGVPLAEGLHHLALTAVDEAGNHSAPVSVDLLIKCATAPPASDAGTLLPPIPHLPDCGCGVGTLSQPLGVLLFALLRFRRRRS